MREDLVRSTDHSLNLLGRMIGTLTTDLNLKPSRLMVTDESIEDAEPAEFEWYCEKGLEANI